MLAMMAGNTDDAIQAFAKLGQENPKGPARFLAAYLSLRLGHAEAAARAYDALAQDDPFHPWVRVGQVLARLQGDPAAVERGLGPAPDSAKGVIALWPEMPEAHATLGCVHVLRGEHALALKALDRALELDPDTLEAHRWRAAALAALDDKCEAVVAFTRVLALDPTAGDALLRRAELYFDLGEKRRGQADLKVYLDRFVPEADRERVKAYLEAKK